MQDSTKPLLGLVANEEELRIVKVQRRGGAGDRQLAKYGAPPANLETAAEARALGNPLTPVHRNLPRDLWHT